MIGQITFLHYHGGVGVCHGPGVGGLVIVHGGRVWDEQRRQSKNNGSANPPGSGEAESPAATARPRPVAAPTDKVTAGAAIEPAFRFYDNRQKYLMFVHTCSEKWVVADRVGMELAHIQVTPPALRVFDAGMGDGTVLIRTLRHMHRRFPTVPFYVVVR